MSKIRCLFAVGALVIILSLTACDGKTNELTLTEFQCEVSVENEESQIVGVFSFISPDEMNFTVLSPEEMKDLTLNYSKSDISISVGKLSLPLTEVGTEKDLFSPLFEAVSLLAVSQSEISTRGENLIAFAGRKGEYELNFSSDEMKILSFENNGTTYSFQY